MSYFFNNFKVSKLEKQFWLKELFLDLQFEMETRNYQEFQKIVYCMKFKSTYELFIIHLK